MIQRQLFKTSVLCKLAGALVLIKVNPFGPKGTEGCCPLCKSTQFEEASFGWTECSDCHDFSLLTTHLKEIERQVA